MKKILIIEDDTALRETTAEFIQREKFEVFMAKDGLEGIQQTLQHLPDLILCDISMPNMDGFEFYKTIKQIKATATIPLVFFSAKTENEDIRAGMQLGADDYIVKPFEFSELLNVIKTRLAKYEEIEKFHDEKFHAAIKHPTLGIFIYQNNKFIYYNETLINIFGQNDIFFSKGTFKDLIHENLVNKKKILNTIDRCLKDTTGSISLRFKTMQKNVNLISVELSATVITYKGQPSLIGNVLQLDNLKTAGTLRQDSNDSVVKLSTREFEVLELICQGKSTLEVSKILFLGVRTIESHRANLLEKTQSRNIAELLLYAIRTKLIQVL